MHRLAFCLIVAGALAGCGAPPNPPQVDSDIPDYPALQDLFSVQNWGPVEGNASTGKWPKAKEALQNPALAEAFAAFEKEPIPSKFSTPEREAARKEIIKAIKAAIDGAKSGASDAELKANLEMAREQVQKMQKPIEKAQPKK